MECTKCKVYSGDQNVTNSTTTATSMIITRFLANNDFSACVLRKLIAPIGLLSSVLCALYIDDVTGADGTLYLCVSTIVIIGFDGGSTLDEWTNGRDDGMSDVEDIFCGDSVLRVNVLIRIVTAVAVSFRCTRSNTDRPGVARLRLLSMAHSKQIMRLMSSLKHVYVVSPFSTTRASFSDGMPSRSVCITRAYNTAIIMTGKKNRNVLL
jgi:hypothetical protein